MIDWARWIQANASPPQHAARFLHPRESASRTSTDGRRESCAEDVYRCAGLESKLSKEQGKNMQTRISATMSNGLIRDCLGAMSQDEAALLAPRSPNWVDRCPLCFAVALRQYALSLPVAISKHPRPEALIRRHFSRMRP